MVCFEAWDTGETGIDAQAGRAVVAETIWHVRNFLTRAGNG